MNAESNALIWLNSRFVKEEDKNLIRIIQKTDPKRFEDNFSKNLEMGTGGLRAVMDIGPNKMNVYTVSQATQALANHLKKQGAPHEVKLKVIIAHDTRNRSKEFAQISSRVLSANDIEVFMSGSPMPTPHVSFLVRSLKANAGIMITASHNPKEYNGFKIFNQTGAQPINPEDANIIKAYNDVKSFDQIQFDPNPSLIKKISENMLEDYYKSLNKTARYLEFLQSSDAPKMVYTSFHGVGSYVIPSAMKSIGFQNALLLEEQCVPNGDFPTVPSPNPEEDESFQKAFEFAEENDADFILATDPDVDRLRIAVRHEGKYTLLDGNQIGVVLLKYLIETRPLPKEPYVVTTIVTSPLVKLICQKHNIRCVETLTGFKYIGDVVNQEGEENFLFACEESCGYLVNSLTRDKDAVSGSTLIAEMMAYLKNKKISLIDYLIEIYENYGFYFSRLESLNKTTPSNQASVDDYVKNMKLSPPNIPSGESVQQIDDYQVGFSEEVRNKRKTPLTLPSSKVLALRYGDGTKVIVRPSGTEPKIKFYFTLSLKYEKSLSYFKNIENSKNLLKEIKNIFFT